MENTEARAKAKYLKALKATEPLNKDKLQLFFNKLDENTPVFLVACGPESAAAFIHGSTEVLAFGINTVLRDNPDIASLVLARLVIGGLLDE